MTIKEIEEFDTATVVEEGFTEETVTIQETSTNSKLRRRRQIEDLLEDKRLQKELSDYEES